MPKQVKILAGLNLALLVAIAASLFFSPEARNSAGEAERSVRPLAVDRPELVDEIRINGTSLARQNDDTWKVNGEHYVQPEMLRTLSFVCLQAEVKRPVSEAVAGEIRERLSKEGMTVRFIANGKETLVFKLAGDENDAFVETQEGELYYIHMPGKYVDIPALFTDRPEDWRDKRVLYTEWKWVQSIELTYPVPVGMSDVVINYDSTGFYRVEGVSELDSANLYDYISRFQSFYVQDFLGDEGPLIDSLKTRNPYCVVKTRNLFKRFDNTLEIYPPSPKSDGRFYGIIGSTGEVVLLDPSQVRRVVTPLGYFDRSNRVGNLGGG